MSLLDLDETALISKITELETLNTALATKIVELEAKIIVMPDDIKAKFKDVLTWVLQNI